MLRVPDREGMGELHGKNVLCVHRKREGVSALRSQVTRQGSTPLSLILLSLLSVLLLTVFVMSRPS